MNSNFQQTLHTRENATGMVFFRWLVGTLIILRIVLLACFIASAGEYMEADSEYYLRLSKILADHGVFSQSEPPTVNPQIFRTPGYPAFLAMLHLTGMESPYWAVFWQEIIYAACMAIFFFYGKPLFGNKITRLGLLFLLLEPGGLSTPKMLLSETLFLPFLMVGLLLIGHYLRLRPDWKLLASSGVLFGIGAWIRPVIMYFPFILAATLVIFDHKNLSRWLHASLLLLMFVVTISPWLLRNYYYFDTFFMSGQQSNMLANYHVPVVWESALGLPFWEGHARIKEKVQQAIQMKSTESGQRLNKVEKNAIEQQLALQELKKYPWHYSKQWVFGILKTMNGANLLSLYHAFDYRSERLRFFEIEATDFKDKVIVFLSNQDYPYILEVCSRVVLALLALIGVLAVYRKKDCFLWVVLLANFYFISTPGPMGYARFRFPVEVFWFIQAYLGLILLSSWLQFRKNSGTQK